MHDRFSVENHLPEQSIIELDSDTARWTSPAYGVRFGRVAEVMGQAAQQETFRVSAWGLSAGLTDLLADYSEGRASLCPRLVNNSPKCLCRRTT